jgi:hypothetical protein
MASHPEKSLILALGLAFVAGEIWPQSVATHPPAALTSAEIVVQMQLHNLKRTQELKQYKALRHYKVQYTGLTSIAGTMEVEILFNAATGKSFRIVSQSGSKFLCEKVLKRAVDSEKEAAHDQSATALSAANYKFHLAGSENLKGRPAYILDVEPLTKSKFLYRGKIWVDEADFALAKIEAEPAKNPSFWISRTLILQTFEKKGRFWLPELNRSETKVRIGGSALFTIDYGNYEIGSNAPDSKAAL